ncbi:MAG TPA: LysE family translocator [Ktedonobacteraceae bacterium]|nr:LysE family translocator [Ktedonobacteraceae bacterium]
MPTATTIALFLVAGLGLVLIPGPNIIYIVTRSVDQGRRAGLVSALGVEVATLVHVTAAAFGLSALLLSSALAFSVVKYVGAAYLIYLGIRTLLTRDQHQETVVVEPKSLSHIFFQGVLVNLLNPKTALFFFAFLPQFVDPARGAVVGQVLFFGILLNLLGLCNDILYALLADRVGKWLKGTAQFRRVQRYVTGGIYLALGVTTALTGSEKK